MSRQEEHSKAIATDDRIKQLNELDRDIAQLLKSAGMAVEALTDRPLSEEHGDVSSPKEAFTQHASRYFSRLSAIDVRLRRQIYALEEAQIIQADAGAKDGSTQTTSFAAGAVASQNSEKSAGSAGGPSNLDVAWLNSRNDKVAKEFEAEIWAEADVLVSDLAAGQRADPGGSLSTESAGGAEREVAEHAAVG